jgi:fructosamine-3-kinase
MRYLREATAAFACRYFGERPSRLDLYRLGGGLEPGKVVRARAVLRRRVEQFVVKTAAEAVFRERIAYERLLAKAGDGIAPRLLGAASHRDTGYLFLEWIPGRRRWPWSDPVCRWPWSDPVSISSMLRQLARAHRSLAGLPFPAPLAAWNYDHELEASACATLSLAERLRALGGVHRALPALRRVTASVPRMRRQLRSEDPLPGVLHGDVHSGNVIVRGEGSVVFLDWSRVRTGSALEDVGSWLKSLARWEPQALRLHDTLLRSYLGARGAEWRSNLRGLYWLAGASNALSGALRYELAVAGDAARSDAQRARALATAAGWLRIIRRADACWT